MKDSLLPHDYDTIFDNDLPLQFVNTNTRTNQAPKTKTTNTTRNHAEFIRTTALNTEDFPLAQLAQPTTRRKQQPNIAYSFKDALTADNHYNTKQQQPYTTTKKKIQQLVNQTIKNNENPIPNSILINDQIKEQITIQLSDLTNGGPRTVITEHEIKEHIQKIMLNTDSFTNILDSHTEKIKNLTNDIPTTQWLTQMTNRVQAMEHENEKAATSLQNYEIGLQKAERNMRKMNMAASQTISKTDRAEETLSALQTEVKQLRTQIANLEKSSRQQTELHHNTITPALSKITRIELELTNRPTRTDLQHEIHSQINQWAQAIEAKFEDNITRTTIQNNLNIGMTMYNAMATNKNNSQLQHWSKNTNNPLQTLQIMAFKPDDVDAGLLELFKGQHNDTLSTNPTNTHENEHPQYQDQSPPDGREDGDIRPDNTNV
jgi:hypothetical protein